MSIEFIMKVIALTNNIKELKENIRQLVKDYLKTNEDVHISIVYYEVKTYKKPKK